MTHSVQVKENQPLFEMKSMPLPIVATVILLPVSLATTQ